MPFLDLFITHFLLLCRIFGLFKSHELGNLHEISQILIEIPFQSEKKDIAALNSRGFWTNWDLISWVQKFLLLKVFHFGQNNTFIRTRMIFYPRCQSTPYGVRGPHNSVSASVNGWGSGESRIQAVHCIFFFLDSCSKSSRNRSLDLCLPKCIL